MDETDEGLLGVGANAISEKYDAEKKTEGDTAGDVGTEEVNRCCRSVQRRSLRVVSL